MSTRASPMQHDLGSQQHATEMMLTAAQDEPSASQPTTAGGRRSISPDASSLFDVSGMNTSQDTTITEPDLDAPITATAAAAATATVTATAPTAPVAPAAAPIPSLFNTFASPQTRRVSTREELKQVCLTL